MTKPYSQYNSVDLPWLFSIPDGWTVKKIKHICNVYNGNSLNDQNKESFKNTGASDCLNYISSKDINVGNNQITYQSGIAIPKEITIYKVAPSNSSLLCIEGGSAGRKVAFTNQEVCFVNKLACFYNKNEFTSKFIYYYLRSKPFKDQFKLAMTGMIGGVSISSLNNFKLPFPSNSEQESIVLFLSNNVDQLEKLIEEKQNFITLLEQKRKALISEVVTKGLDSSVPMKDSGIDWIGEVPEHWSVTRLGYIGSCQNGINISGDSFGSGYPFISYGDVYKNRVLPESVKGLVQSTNVDREKYFVESGDVLFTRTSETADEIAFSSVCKKNMPNSVFAGFLIRFRPHEKSQLDVNFAEFYFQNQTLREFFTKEMNVVTRASLSQELLKRLPVILPPMTEQAEIATILKQKTNDISDLINETKNSISLLKEQKESLITAAVTGQIDVREYA